MNPGAADEAGRVRIRGLEYDQATGDNCIGYTKAIGKTTTTEDVPRLPNRIPMPMDQPKRSTCLKRASQLFAPSIRYS